MIQRELFYWLIKIAAYLNESYYFVVGQIFFLINFEKFSNRINVQQLAVLARDGENAFAGDTGRHQGVDCFVTLAIYARISGRISSQKSLKKIVSEKLLWS